MSESILIIDDDPIQRMLAADALGEHYTIIEGETGETIVEQVSTHKPTLVLLDIMMPGINGYEACRRLRDDFDVGETPVVFLSANVGRDDRIAAYDAGGEDFIGKPFDPEELRAKVTITLKRITERAQLKTNVSEAFSTAMTAMTSASELGIVIHALRQSFTATTLAELADVALAATRDFSLEACIRLHGQLAGDYVRSSQGEATPVEAGVLQQLALGDHIQRLGRQSAYNYGGITLLIKNMPVDEEERMGRLRDNLALLAEGIEGRRQAIEDRHAVERERQRQRQVGATMTAALNDITRRHQAQKHESADILNGLVNRMEDAFLGLALTERQEAAVFEVMQEAVGRVINLYDEGLAIDEHLASLRAALQ